MSIFRKKEEIIDPVKGRKIQTIYPTYQGGIADFKGHTGKLIIYENQLEFIDGFHKDRTFTIKSNELASYLVEGKDETQHRITATRLVTLGVFALAAKKKEVEHEQYLTLVLNDGRNIIFSHSNQFIDTIMFKGTVSTAFSQLKGAFVAKQDSPNTSGGAASEIEKYANLLEKGAITKAEFEAKKKQLLEL
jgi:hypothetical protein